MICACCPDCRLRFSPAASAYLDACPGCGKPPKAAPTLEAVVGFRLVGLDNAPHAPGAATAAVSLPVPDPTAGR
jgi:hypothetical protein